MYCPKCGEQNPDEAKFCGKCGATITAATGFQASHSAPGPSGATGSGAVSPMMKNGMIVASIVVPLIGIVAGIIFLLDANPEKKAAGKLWLIIGIAAAVLWTLLFGGA